jgi:hypothetical protein
MAVRKCNGKWRLGGVSVQERRELTRMVYIGLEAQMGVIASTQDTAKEAYPSRGNETRRSNVEETGTPERME